MVSNCVVSIWGWRREREGGIEMGWDGIRGDGIRGEAVGCVIFWFAILVYIMDPLVITYLFTIDIVA